MFRLPILAGPLRGQWWAIGGGGKILRVLLGSYEPEQTRLMEALVPSGGTVLDVGAHTGYYTLLGSRLVGARGQVWSFEPSPRNARYLRRHVTVNRCRNVVVEEAAVSDRSGVARFASGSGTGTGRLDAAGGAEVTTVSLDEYTRTHGIRPDLIKIDVEGAEAAVLKGAESVLREFAPTLLLSVHGAAARDTCLAWLADQNYEAVAVTGEAVSAAVELLCRPGPGAQPAESVEGDRE